MDRREAIELLKPFRNCMVDQYGCPISDVVFALDLAIEVLQGAEDMGEVSDGYHTFNQLYHQRAVLFATIVNQNKDKAWKSWKHEDGKFCFDKEGEWFIVGVDTPEGSYTYHYEKKYWDMFDCEELDKGKHWDGHTEDDVTRLLSLQPTEQVTGKLKKPCDSLLTADLQGCKEQKSKLDCISRQQAIEALIGWQTEPLDEDIKRTLENLPTVTPTERTGEWIVHSLLDEGRAELECPICGDFFIRAIDYKPHFCEHCGAKMKG